MQCRANPHGVEFIPPTRKTRMKIAEFMKRLREWKSGNDKLVYVSILFSQQRIRLCFLWLWQIAGY